MLTKKFKSILTRQIDAGNSLETKTKAVGQSDDLDKIISEYEKWNEENKHILKNGFVQHAQQFFRTYDGVIYLGNIHVKEESFEYKRDKLLYCLPKQISHLRTCLNHLQSISTTSLLPLTN